MRSLLVTGGAGFIGTNFVYLWRREHPEDRLVNLDLLTYAGNLENLTELPDGDGYTFVRGDITDEALLDRLFAEHRFTHVVNFAAESHVDRSITGPKIFVHTNIIGTQSLLDAARKHGVERFLQVSTDEVYGTLGKTGKFTEATPLEPNSPYSSSKAGADMLVRAYGHTFDLPVVTTRCSNNYGPYQFPEKLIPLMITRALADEPLPVYGDGMQIRDWLHVSDHCRAIEQVLLRGRTGEVYNIGGNNEHPNIDIVQRVLSHLGKPDSLIRYVTDRPGHDRRYAIDATRMKDELGWEPAYTFEQGLPETIDWYLANRTWWERILSGAYSSYYADQYGGREVISGASAAN